MKKSFFAGSIMRMTKGILPIILLVFLFHFQTQAQTYYSNFSDPTNKYETAGPSGVLCLFPSFTSAKQVADLDLTNHTSVTGLLGLGLICVGNDYTVKTKIALPNGTTQMPAGSYAGFKMQLNSILNLTILQNNLSLRTYLRDTLQEATNGAGLLGLSVLSLSIEPATLSFQTTKPFDAVEIKLGTSIIALGLLFNYQFYYGFASTNLILPVKLTNFTSNTDGKNVHLNWATASEYNVARYQLERSNDGGLNFTTIGTVVAKGNSSAAATYSFIDAVTLNGNFTYRIKIIDKDGSAEYSKLNVVKVADAPLLKVFPTLLSRGEEINVKLLTGNTAKTQIQLTNLQGQVVCTATTADSKISITTSNLAAGVYLLKGYQNGQLRLSEKIIIQ